MRASKPNEALVYSVMGPCSQAVCWANAVIERYQPSSAVVTVEAAGAASARIMGFGRFFSRDISWTSRALGAREGSEHHDNYKDVEVGPSVDEHWLSGECRVSFEWTALVAGFCGGARRVHWPADPRLPYRGTT